MILTIHSHSNLMTPTIISFIAITAILISLIVWSNRKDYEDLNIIFTVTLACFGIFGWGLFLSLSTDRTEIMTQRANVVETIKGKHITVVSTSENHNQIYSNYQSDVIDSTTQFKWRYTYYYNYYGFEIKKITEFISENVTTKNTLTEIRVAR